jgi:hypothetical protein
LDFRGKKTNYKRHYHDYLFGRKTLENIADNLVISVDSLRKYFDELEISSAPKPPPIEAINCILDATFFGREYGYLSFHDTHQIFYTKEIKTESLAELNFCLDELVLAGYKFKSFTLDGKVGFVSALKKRFPEAVVQMCILHQKMIIRRYITTNPKTECGRDLKEIMEGILQDNLQEFLGKFTTLKNKHKSFWAVKDDAGKFKHKRLRSAVKSIETNMPLLFQYKQFPELKIPHTINHIEGAFSHLKEKINIHRGLNIVRKKRAILFLLMGDFCLK